MLYCKDSEATFERLSKWWNREDIGRPALQIMVPRSTPYEVVNALAKPEGWSTDYSTRDFAYRTNLAARACVSTEYFGEGLPNVAPDVAPGCLALYLGCQAAEGNETVWLTPCIEDPDSARFEVSPENFYWKFTKRLVEEQLKIGKGKFITAFPDLIEGLDTLAAMRGTEEVLCDILERPAWVRQSLEKITSCYFECYDFMYDRIRDARGGSYFWSWAPGRISKLQCDVSAMMSPVMFKEFMVPVLEKMTARLDYCIYHWDGPGAIPHHDALLAIPGLDVLQWMPGANAEPEWHERWWPLYHKTFDAGKRVLLFLGLFHGQYEISQAVRLKKEFGQQFKQFMFVVFAHSDQEAQELLVRSEV